MQEFSPQDISERSAEAAQFLKQLANSNRLMILCVLLDGELSVGELNTNIPLSQSALSQHLAKLREAGLVATRREAKSIFYRIEDQKVVEIIKVLHSSFCAG